MEEIDLDDTKVILKRYRLRVAGSQGASMEITLPKAVVARECRRLGIPESEAITKIIGVWKFNSFRGLHLDFELKEKPAGDTGNAK